MGFQKSMHVNAQVIPVDKEKFKDVSYLGHYLFVQYVVDIEQTTTFIRDKINIDELGNFNFRLPTSDLIPQLIGISLYAPNGEMIFTENYNYQSFKAVEIAFGAENSDNSDSFQIEVNPKEMLIAYNSLGFQEEININGIIIDSSGTQELSNIQLIIWGKEETKDFRPLLMVYTDHKGHFFTKLKNISLLEAYVTITGENNEKLAVQLDGQQFPKELLLVADFSNIEVKIFKDTNLSLPEHNELVNSDKYSQDLGGKCIDFTIPNRTLDEFSFYHIVRTSEPEIKDVTISKEESKKAKDEIENISIESFKEIDKLTNSFKSITMMKIKVEDTNFSHKVSTCEEYVSSFNKVVSLHNSIKEINKSDADIVYASLKGIFHKVDIYTSLPFSDPPKNICNELIEKWNKKFITQKKVWDILNRYENNKNSFLFSTKHVVLESKLLNSPKMPLLDFNKNLKISNDIQFNNIFTKHKGLENRFELLQKKLKMAYCSKEGVPDAKSFCMIVANELGLGDEYCKSTENIKTRGIICLQEEFGRIQKIIKNKKVLTLNEISEINSYTNIFSHSLSNFINLLDEFYELAKESHSELIVITDKYFINNYKIVKNSLQDFQNKIDSLSKRMNILETEYIENHSGRKELTVENSIDWDDTPTIHQNTTIAHGHILHFKQKWKADGYSLGDLLYSLPLAPCQEKQIAILDWDRKESALRDEDQLAFDSLDAIVSRDRDIHENADSIFKETSRGISGNITSSMSAGVAGGVGGMAGPVVFGAVGGFSTSNSASVSTSAQSSARSLSASNTQSIRDQTMQSASSMRSLRSTTVETINQKEGVNALTEVIKNNNHCHSMTIEYFQVLRHYALEEELVDVQECLFIPLPMDLFDHSKVLRWRHTLSSIMNNRKLVKGIDAIERIETKYENVNLPEGMYADAEIEEFSGYLYLKFDFKRPSHSEIDEQGKKETFDLIIYYPWYTGNKMVLQLNQEVLLTETDKDRIFEKNYAPDIAKEFINTLEVFAIDDNGIETDLKLDLTLVSNYRKGRSLKVKISSKENILINRTQIKHLLLRANTEVQPSSNIILKSLYLSYRTRYLTQYIIRNSHVNNDIIATDDGKSDTAYLYTPLNKKELQNPKKEDIVLANTLISFLNENLELAHSAIWSSMDSNRLFGLMDGYIAPNSDNKSVASVVSNKIMGIVGNNLVLKVSAGHRLDPIFRHVENLLNHYKPTTKPDPYRISIPTKGVYTESVMGKCNSCETIDDSRHWRFEDEPCGTKPTTNIGDLSTDSRRAQPSNLQTKDLPTNIINMQNSPAMPNPTGLGELYGLMGKGDSFRDMTGLAGTQANALSALQTTSKSVTDLANISKDFASLAVLADSKKSVPRQIGEVKKLKDEGHLTENEATEAIKGIIEQPNKAIDSITGNRANSNNSVANKIVEKAISEGVTKEGSSIEYQAVSNDGKTESIKINRDTLLASSRTSQPMYTPKYFVKKSVGYGAVNQSSDVLLTKERFEELGYDWLGLSANGTPNDKFIGIIKLFQHIIHGKGSISDTDKRIDGVIEPNKRTERWLQAENAPRWEEIDNGSRELGYVYNKGGNGDDKYATHWLIDTIKSAGKKYLELLNPEGELGNNVAINVHELSNKKGIYSGHQTHRTGLNVDIRLPHKHNDNDKDNITNVGGITHESDEYDQEATRKIIQSFKQQPLVTQIGFNDKTLIDEGLCQHIPGHDNHIHIQIKAPEIGGIEKEKLFPNLPDGTAVV